MRQHARFVRRAPGEWECIEPATLELDSGRVQVAEGTRLKRGQRFMGVDIADLLEETFEPD